MNTDPQVVVWLDGGLRDPATASVHWSDHGLTVGDQSPREPDERVVEFRVAATRDDDHGTPRWLTV